MHASCLAWGKDAITPAIVTGARVLEVGSFDVNGSLRQHVESLAPLAYVGIDRRPGRGVDRVLDASEIGVTFLPGEFDVVISTETLEHVLDWRAAMQAMWHALKTGGYLFLSARGPGFPRHDFPSDYWRFSLTFMRGLFPPGAIVSAEGDWGAPGVFLVARRVDGELVLDAEPELAP